MREFTLRALILGVILGLVFAVGNAYLGLKVGMTVSASIPAAVMSMAILRLIARNSTILENNIVQTMASAGEAMAGGIIFTVPALTFLGAPPSIWKVFLIGLLGGILGILMMVPLRHHLIVEEAKNLPYPEGTACAKILRTRESGGHMALITILGLGVGALSKLCMGVFRFWDETVRFGLFRLDTSPALLGVGAIIGPRYSLILGAGGILGWWVLIPLLISAGVGTSADAVWASHIRYIGTGAVAFGGTVSLVRLMPMLFRSFAGHFGQLFKDSIHSHGKARTERDLKLKWVGIGILVILGLCFFLPTLEFNWLSVILVLVLSFFFVALTSMTVGLVGVSSNPVSGMVIITLLVTTLTFLGMGWIDKIYSVMAMSVGCVVGVGVVMAGDISQDLKTGHLVEATPFWQQIAMMIGVIAPAAVMGWVLMLLDSTYGFGTPELPAPQATLMALIVKGVIESSLPLALVGVGMVIALVVELMGIRSIAFAIGLYLPLGTTLAIAFGGILSWGAHKITRHPDVGEQTTLTGSGLVAGDALTGVLVAFLAVLRVIQPDAPAMLGQWASIVAYGLVILAFGILACRRARTTV